MNTSPTFTIDRSGFATLCPPLAVDERARLESSILEHGCRDPLVVWIEEDVLLDGHNREQICRKHGIPYTVVGVSLPDRAAAHAWVIDNQLGRRNLSPDQASYLRGKKYEAEKLPEGRPAEKLPQSEGVTETAERVAAETGVSRATVERDAKFARNVDRIAELAGPKARTAILTGGIKMTRAQVAKAAEKGVTTIRELKKVASGPKTRRPRPEPRTKPEFEGLANDVSSLMVRLTAARLAVQQTEGAVPGVPEALQPLRKLASEIDALIAALQGQEQ